MYLLLSKVKRILLNRQQIAINATHVCNRIARAVESHE